MAERMPGTFSSSRLLVSREFRVPNSGSRYPGPAKLWVQKIRVSPELWSAPNSSRAETFVRRTTPRRSKDLSETFRATRR